MKRKKFIQSFTCALVLSCQLRSTLLSLFSFIWVDTAMFYYYLTVIDIMLPLFMCPARNFSVSQVCSSVLFNFIATRPCTNLAYVVRLDEVTLEWHYMCVAECATSGSIRAMVDCSSVASVDYDYKLMKDVAIDWAIILMRACETFVEYNSWVRSQIYLLLLCGRPRGQYIQILLWTAICYLYYVYLD